MSNISSEKAFDRAIDLALQADHLANVWTGRLVVVQTSLVIAEGVLFFWKGDVPGSEPIRTIFAGVLAGIGIVLTLGLTHIVTREHKYGHMFMQLAKQAEGEDPYLGEDLSPMGPRFTTVMWIIGSVLTVAWMSVLMIIIEPYLY